MPKPKVVMNRTGAVALRNSPEMRGILRGIAEQMAERAGPGFVGDVQEGKTRAHGMVKSTDLQSMEAQAERSALTKAIRG
ncbi:hypothetical protein [Microbacterium sp.]|uniref:hypothetical protein n=1 Tax=Microbacterium sp. TaxID=51671 RepID=UPI003A8FF54F